MYINKVVFAEYQQLMFLPTAIYDALVEHTDYGHSEILSDHLIDLLKELDEDKDAYSFTKEEFEDEVRNALGSDVYEALLKNEIDFVSVIYD